jgi:D-cysteine desulfhydrase
MGGTTPLADLAFVSAALELADRVAAGALPAPATVVLALGSGGSAAGLALGLALAGLPTRVVAVRCSSPGTSSRAKVAAELDGAAALLARLAPGLQADGAAAGALERARMEAHARLLIEPRFLGRGYALATPAGSRTAELVADREGVHLDPTYSSKAAAALVEDAARFAAGPTVLWLGCDAKWLAGGG